MKLAFVTREYHKKGGISRCVVELAERLSIDNEVHVFCNKWDKELVNNKITFHRVFTITKPLFLSVPIFVLCNYFILKKYKFDSIISPTTSCIKADIFTAHSCHKAWVEYKKKSVAGLVRYFLNPLHHIILFLEKINFRKGNYKKIISISKTTKNDIIKYYNILENDIAVIYNGVNTKEFSELNKDKYRAELRNQLGINENQNMLLFISNEFYRKGLKTVILAAKKFLSENKAKLVVIGNDDSAPYLNIAKKLNVENNILFLGRKNDAYKYYAACDIFVFPTKLEPFGLVITEAMASGAAVITTKYAGAAELIEDGTNGLLLNDSDDVNELNQKISVLINDSALMSRIGANAAKTIKQYDWDNIKELSFKLYKDASGGK